mgnify:CR=1 FL=1
MTEAEKAYQYFVIAVPENEEQAKAYFWARKALQSTLTQPNDWISVEDRLPEPGERVLATDCGFVGEFYINKRGKWQRYNVNCSELLMALDILYWMPLPAPPDKDNNVPAKTPNEPLTLEQLREMDGEPVWIANPDALEYGRWGIVDGVYQAEDDQVLMLRGDYSCHYYGKTWLAYRRPPEGKEEMKDDHMG